MCSVSQYAQYQQWSFYLHVPALLPNLQYNTHRLFAHLIKEKHGVCVCVLVGTICVLGLQMCSVRVAIIINIEVI